MGTSVGDVTDYLVALTNTAMTGITSDSTAPVYVFDGYPTSKAEASVVIGLDAPPDIATQGPSGSRAWVGTGQPGRTQEDYVVPFYIDVFLGGDDMKPVRDLAIQIFDAIWAALFADLSFGGLLSPLPASIDEVRWTPTISGTQAAQGRRVLCQFGVRCQNRYIT